MEKVGFELGLLLWYVLRYSSRPYRLASAIAGGDFKYFFVKCYLLFLFERGIILYFRSALSVGSCYPLLYLFVFLRIKV